MSDPYRPTTFDGIVGQPTEEIESYLDGPRTPNFLFYGPPGTGKTTAAKVIGRRLQGSVDELMEFNASDDRGIDVVRDEIIPATGQTTLTGAPRVIFLDEMEAMTQDAQWALRSPMEQSSSVFVLACNDRDGVHDALLSRCRDYEFEPVPDAAVRERITQIAAADDVDLSDRDLKTIVSFANGDMRGAIQRYTQVVRGVRPADDGPAPTDGSSLEGKAREFLDESGA